MGRSEVREHVRKLEQIYSRLKSCRVRVEQRADNQHHTIPPVVRVELGIPGRKEIVVAHEPERLQRKYQRPDLHNAINEAFRIATQQLSALKEERSEPQRLRASARRATNSGGRSRRCGRKRISASS